MLLSNSNGLESFGIYSVEVHKLQDFHCLRQLQIEQQPFGRFHSLSILCFELKSPEILPEMRRVAEQWEI